MFKLALAGCTPVQTKAGETPSKRTVDRMAKALIEAKREGKEGDVQLQVVEVSQPVEHKETRNPDFLNQLQEVSDNDISMWKLASEMEASLGILWTAMNGRPCHDSSTKAGRVE